ncbi:PAP2 superfamily protein [Lachnospiraceae bacterium XBB1006]|nr:PAP2 superfamily protein [Lachnospiraceae bacterium XBB1006]
MQFLWLLTNIRTAVGNELALAITKCGQQTVLIVLLCAIYWCLDKQVALRAAFSFCLSGLSAQNLKLIFRIPRPWLLDKQFSPVKAAIKGATGFSFPSGHTQSATSIYGSLFVSEKKAPKWIRILIALMPFLVGFSRMYLGVHTPKDVLTAFCISILCIGITHWLFSYMESEEGILQYVLPGLCVLGAILSVVHGYILYTRGIVEYAKIVDCAKTGGVAFGFVVGYYLEKRFVKFQNSQNRLCNVIKLIIGLALLIALNKGMKAVFKANIIFAVLQKAILVIFILAGYPLILKLVNKKNKSENAYEK